MATDTATLMTTPDPEHESVLAKAALQVRRFVCGLHGHDSLMHFERGRISLLCASCGHETPGWEVKAAPTRRDNAESPRVVQLPLVHRRAA